MSLASASSIAEITLAWSFAEITLAWSFSAESAGFSKNNSVHKSLIVREMAHEAKGNAVYQTKLEIVKHTDDVLCMKTPFWERIQKVRNTELDTLWASFRVQTFNSFLLNAIPTFVSVGTFTVYVLLGNKLTAAKAFTSLSLFSVS